MKKILCALLLAPLAAAQEPPRLIFEDGEYELEIPYFSFGEKAYEVMLHTPEDSDELLFQVDMDSLRRVAREQAMPYGENDGACTATTSVGYLACRAEAEDDYFIGLGDCLNRADSGVKSACMEALAEEQEEASEECELQMTARAQICLVVGEAPYDPPMNPASFMSKSEIMAAPNDYLPLVPGNQWIYESEEETVTVTVTEETREILGITAIVVRDIVSEDGEPVEETDDWFAQDVDGNVWYMGEIAKNYEDGRLVDLDGSWEAGRDGARAGILIRAMPNVGETLRQEFLLGEAEDLGRTVNLQANAESGAEAGVVCMNNCLQVLEYNPLEPDALEHKFYYPGIGNILTVDLENGEREELVAYSIQ